MKLGMKLVVFSGQKLGLLSTEFNNETFMKLLCCTGQLTNVWKPTLGQFAQ